MNDAEKLRRIRIIVDGYPSHNTLAQAVLEILNTDDEGTQWTDTGTGPGYDPRD